MRRRILSYKVTRLFDSRKGHLDARVQRDYIRNAIVSIPCSITEYHDVISPYSVKGFETLNPEFVDYVKETAELTPTQYPLILNIVEDCLTEEERNTIEYVIRDDFAYDLGVTEKDLKRHVFIFFFMLVCLILSGIALFMTDGGAEIPREVIYIAFWFAGDTLCDYLFLTGYDLRKERRLAGRLASIKVVFSETYENKDYTESDIQRLYSELKQDVQGTKGREWKKGVYEEEQ